MKKFLFVFLQFFLFLITFAVGSFIHPFNHQTVLSQTSAATRVFVWDGLFLVLGVYALILGIELVARRFRSAALWSTLALLAAIAVAFRTGFVTHEF